jgi:hypothetical protein
MISPPQAKPAKRQTYREKVIINRIGSAAPVAGDGWRLLRVWETAMVEALPKNDESVEWWNGEAWDLCPALNLSPDEFYRTRALPRRPPNAIGEARADIATSPHDQTL